MADNAVVHIGENSPQEVAYKLMIQIRRKEFPSGHKPTAEGNKLPDRGWILSTYAECYRVVRGMSPE